MLRLGILVYLWISITITVYSQIYHQNTGKVIPSNTPDTIIWSEGIFNNYNAFFGTLLVKENRKMHNSRLISIPVIRIPSINSNSSESPLFIMNGGPGESNINKLLFSDLIIENRDIIFVGYRGVDGNIKLDCPCYKNLIINNHITINNNSNIFTTAADSCIKIWSKLKIDISGYNMHEVIIDFNTVRKILGYNKISLQCYSFGTLLGQQFSSTYPEYIDKLILIAPRKPYDFLFTPEQINNGSSIIIQHYFKTFLQTSIKKEETQNYLNECFKNIIDNCQWLNEYKLYILFFSKLYDINNAFEILKAFDNANNGDYSDITRIYNSFFNHFMNNNIIGDIFIKKQGYISYHTDTNSIAGKIAMAVNNTYSPVITNNKYYNTSNIYMPNKIDMLTIFGELDIVSSPEYFFDSMNITLHSSNIEVIENACHLDIFYSYKEKLDSVIYKFMEK